MQSWLRPTGAIALAGMWVGLCEFTRNQLLLASVWQSHYASLGLKFPSAPINGAIWMIWSFALAALLYAISRRFSLVQTVAIGWVAGFVLMWLVVWNLMVLPLAVLPWGVPWSLVEAFVASLICVKLSPVE